MSNLPNGLFADQGLELSKLVTVNRTRKLKNGEISQRIVEKLDSQIARNVGQALVDGKPVESLQREEERQLYEMVRAL